MSNPFRREAAAALEKLTALGYSDASAKAVALELLAHLESLPPGLCLLLGKVDEETPIALLTRPPPEVFHGAALGALGTLADDFATAAGAEIGKHTPHLSITPEGLSFSPGKKL